jgi:plastocyanin
VVTRKRSLSAIFGIVLILGLVAGCSSSSDKASTDTGSSAATTGSGATAGTADSVVIKDFAFKPSDLKVKAGTKVTWTNEDSATHTATSDDGSNAPAKFDSGDLPKGKSYSFTFEKPGTYKYHCSIHSYMKGTVTVS